MLEQIKRNELDVGAWVNVIGHVESRKEKGVFVQAVSLWDAGNLDITAYERAIVERKAAA